MLFEPVAPRPSRFAWLWSQGLGLLCGQATVLLLAIGSVEMVSCASAPAPSMDDLRAFFVQPSLWYFWLYLLVPVLVLFAVNTALCTWRNVVRHLRLGHRELSCYAPALVHAAFLLALVAHAVGGLYGEERRAVSIGPSWAALGDGLVARTRGITQETYPSGMPKSVQVQLEWRSDVGAIETATVGFNEPLMFGVARELFLLADYRAVPSGTAGELEAFVLLRARHAPGNSWAFGAVLVLGLGLVLMGRRWG